MISQEKSRLFWVIFFIFTVCGIIIMFRSHLLSKNINNTAAENIAANLTSSSAANYTLRKSDPTKGSPLKNCQELTTVIGHQLPAGFHIMNKELEVDKISLCTLTRQGIKNREFRVMGIN